MLLITHKIRTPVFGFANTPLYQFTCPNDKCGAQHTLYVITAVSKQCENCGVNLPPAVSLFENLRTRLKNHGKSDIPIMRECLDGTMRIEDNIEGWGIPFNMED